MCHAWCSSRSDAVARWANYRIIPRKYESLPNHTTNYRIIVSNSAKKAWSRGGLRLTARHPYLDLNRAPVGAAANNHTPTSNHTQI